MLLLVEDESDFVVYDLTNRKKLAREPAEGPVNRITVWRGSDRKLRKDMPKATNTTSTIITGP